VENVLESEVYSPMIEVLVIAVLSGLIGWQDYNNRKERSKLINALIARTPEQLRDLDFVDKVSVDTVKPTAPDLVPVDQLSDEQFAEMVGGQNG
jgi:hypothetical protein